MHNSIVRTPRVATIEEERRFIMDALERLKYEEAARQYGETFHIDPIALGLSHTEILRGLTNPNKEIEHLHWIDLEDEREEMRSRGIAV